MPVLRLGHVTLRLSWRRSKTTLRLLSVLEEDAFSTACFGRQCTVAYVEVDP